MSGAEEVNRRKSEIIEHLKSIRRIQTPEKRVHELVEFLEGKQSLDQKFNFQDMAVDTYKPNKIRYQEFCQTYMLELFKRFIPNDDDVDIMLVAYNYHPKYMHIKKLIERRNAFARETYEPKHPEKDWGPKPADKDRGLREEEERIIGELAEALDKVIDKNNENKLGFTETVLLIMQSEGKENPPSVEPMPSPPNPIDLPSHSEKNRFQIFLERAKKMLSKYKVVIIASCIIMALIIGAIVVYSTSLLWSGNGSNKNNDYDGPGWGDNGGLRPSYTIDEVNAGALGDQIIFNTISDGAIGNEKNFVGARKYTDIDTGEDKVWEGNDISVEDGKEYTIRLYVHNNNQNGYDGIAEDTRVSFSIPSESSAHVTVYGFIMPSNATPSKYWDYVTFHAPTAFHLEYKPGSALLQNNGIGKGGLLLSDAVVDAANGGSPIGFDSLDGRIPGGRTYDSYILIHVKAIFDVAYTLETQVCLVGGDKTWDNGVEAKIGDKVEFRMAYKNNDTVDHLNVMISSVLPEGLRYVPGSTRLINTAYPNGGTMNSDNIVTTGINIGGYAPGSNAFVRFQAEVVDEGLENGSNTLVNWGQAGVNKACIQDYATVHLIKD